MKVVVLCSPHTDIPQSSASLPDTRYTNEDKNRRHTIVEPTITLVQYFTRNTYKIQKKKSYKKDKLKVQ